MDDDRPYTEEEYAAASRAWEEFAGPLQDIGAGPTDRDKAMFGAGFKRGRRTPPPATAKLLEWARENLAWFGTPGTSRPLIAWSELPPAEDVAAFLAEWEA